MVGNYEEIGWRKIRISVCIPALVIRSVAVRTLITKMKEMQ